MGSVGTEVEPLEISDQLRETVRHLPVPAQPALVAEVGDGTSGHVVVLHATNASGCPATVLHRPSNANPRQGAGSADWNAPVAVLRVLSHSEPYALTSESRHPTWACPGSTRSRRCLDAWVSCRSGDG